MPPLRTVPPARPVKTERTHEENQERAYIAASRRSDRSLEARVESARRASEIHKRRTGRSLRVTEQDVVNEEMYEEEDDDLPMRYRQFGASHLHTSSADFNRRLQAYLTNQIAMRDTNQLFAEQFPNVPQFPQNQQGLYQQQLRAQQFQQQLMLQQQQQQPNQQLQPNVAPAPDFQQTQYPTPNQQFQFYPNMQHVRSASIATPQTSTSSRSPGSPMIKTEPSRRLSLNSMQPPGSTPETASISNSSVKIEPSPSGTPNPSQNPNLFPQFAPGAPFSTSFSPFNNFAPNSTNSVLDFSLPTETQQLLSYDPIYLTSGKFDEFGTTPLVAPPVFTSYDPKYAQFLNSNNTSTFPHSGLNATLAPNDTSGFGDVAYEPDFAVDFFSDSKNSGFGSSNGTPGGADFSMFINEQEHWNPTPNSSQ